jgi:phosphatidyl-myo-inositol alpha-mannosyltransferase
MRIALVSPYSWSFPGGVTRHVEALAEQFGSAGHYVRVLAPLDPPARFSSLLHRGAAPRSVTAPEYLVPLGRTVGFRANGAVSNLSITPYGVATLREELRRGGYDVVHVHEPVAPLVGWVAADRVRLPLVGTFHAYSDRRVPNGVANVLGARRVLGRLDVRIAVSQAAAWTGRRWFGGVYRVIPNGVHVDPERTVRAAPTRVDGRLRIVFVGQPVKRKGLRVLLHAFEALREQIPAELVVIGPSPEQLSRMMRDPRGVHALGRIDDEAKRRELELADVLCAPSLGGESFGMVLTEALAAATPVVASDIAGYREIVRDGLNGVLVPPADPQALSSALRDLWAQPDRRSQMGRAGAVGVQRFAWPLVAAQVLDTYHEAIATTRPSRRFSVLRHRPAWAQLEHESQVEAALSDLA